MPEVDIWGPRLLSTSLGSWLLASTLLRQHFLFFIRLQIPGELLWGHLGDSPVLSDVHIWLMCCREQTSIVKFARLALCPAEPASLYFIGRISPAGERALEILLSVLPGACHHAGALNSGPSNELTKMTRIPVSRHLACENRCACNSSYSFQTESEILLQVNSGQVQIVGKWHFNYDSNSTSPGRLRETPSSCTSD